MDYTHDNLNRIQTISYDGQVVGDYDYTISTNGTSSSLNYVPLTMGFQTDINPFGEMIFHEQEDTGSITWAESFGYDGLGNIESINQNGEISTYQYDDLNRIIQEDVVEGIQTYTYDEKGNRKTMEGTMKLPLGPREFTYNALNQLSTFKENDEETTYQYYVGGLRATKESQNGDFTRYIYFQGNVIEELDQEGNPTARNIWGNQLLYREDMTSSLGGYYFYNGHGDVVKVIADDGSKDVLKEYDYDIWGNVLSETSHETKTFDNPFQYTGEIYDEESGLIYLRARYYDPSIGRFITEDTYEGTISNPLSMNLYTYVYNNPMIYNDPSGHLGNAIIQKYGHEFLGDSTSNNTYNPNLINMFNSVNFVYATPVDTHDMLDAFGLVPFLGEPADLFNGFLYTIEGDKINATLSYASLIPFGGWFASSIKYGIKQTGTVWDTIKATQPFYDGTLLPIMFID
ncbi:RHS repeat-associated core domain-containing protein [Chengkuizengella sediminis]|nr:RHS repeat-associated core domain-containing protein [Chengkuizengella sediminis]